MTSRRGVWRTRLLVVALALFLLVAFLGVTSWTQPAATRVASEVAVLEQQVGELQRLVDSSRVAPLVRADPVLVAVQQSLVESLVAASIPYERRVDRFRVRVDSVRVRFVDGFSLLQLLGRATLADDPEERAYADMTVSGGLEVYALDPANGVLRTRFNVLAVDARRVDFMGQPVPIERKVETLSRERLARFGDLLSGLEIPIQVSRAITLPRAGPEGGVSIDSVVVPLSLAVEEVKAFGGKLWVTLTAGLLPSDSIGARSPAPVVRARPLTPSEPRKGHALRNPKRRFQLFVRVPTVEADFRRKERQDLERKLLDLTTRRQILRDSVARLVQADTLVARVSADTADVVIAVRTPFLTQVLGEATRRYLARVDLDLAPDYNVHHETPLRVASKVGKIHVGTLVADLHLSHLQGRLQGGRPTITVQDQNFVRVDLPVHVEQGRGKGNLAFRWDARSVVNLLCKDFEASLPIEGIALPGDYIATQNFVVEAEGGRLAVQSVAPRDTFRIKVTLTETSWARVWRILKTQDTDERCGMFLEPKDVMEKLKQIGLKGFNIRLPRSLLRRIEWPVGVSREVTIRDRTVALQVTPLEMELTPSLLWYSVSVRTGRGGDTSRAASRSETPAPDSSSVR